MLKNIDSGYSPQIREKELVCVIAPIKLVPFWTSHLFRFSDFPDFPDGWRFLLKMPCFCPHVYHRACRCRPKYVSELQWSAAYTRQASSLWAERVTPQNAGFYRQSSQFVGIATLLGRYPQTRMRRLTGLTIQPCSPRCYSHGPE